MMLSAARERALLELGTNEAKAELVAAFRPLLIMTANRFASPRCEVEDLVSVGTEAILRALPTFRVEAGNRLSSMLHPTIYRSMRRYVASNDVGQYALPERKWLEVVAARRAGRPRALQTWQELDAEAERRELVALAQPPLALSMLIGEGPTELADLLHRAHQPDDEMTKAMQPTVRGDVFALLDQLAERDRWVIQLRLGLLPESEPMTFSNIAATLGISVGYARCLYREAVMQLRVASNIDRVSEAPDVLHRRAESNGWDRLELRSDDETPRQALDRIRGEARMRRMRR